MAGKPGSRNWNDIQMVLAALSMAATLWFWNLFAGPDRASAEEKAREAAAAAAVQPVVQPGVASVSPTPMSGPIFFGGSAPQTTIVVQSGGGGGGGGGGGAVTSTSSS